MRMVAGRTCDRKGPAKASDGCEGAPKGRRPQVAERGAKREHTEWRGGRPALGSVTGSKCWLASH
jgi:hypothetical protein